MTTETQTPLRDRLQGFVIPNGDTAYTLVTRLDENTRSTYLKTWSRLYEEHDRTPPYDPEKLKDLNQSNRVNVNTGEMEAAIDEATAAATETVFSPGTLIDPVLQTALPQAPASVPGMQAVVAQEYTDLLDKHLDMFGFVDEAHRDTMLLGFTAAVWPHARDWRPKQFDIDRFRFPKDCPIRGCDVPLFGLRRGIPVRDLMSRARGEEADWNQDLLRRALLDHFEGGARTDSTTTLHERFHRLAVRYDRGDSQLHADALSEVPVVDLFCTDPTNGKVAHLIVWEGPGDAEADQESHNRAEEEVEGIRNSLEEGHLLYVKMAKYEEMGDALWLMTYNKGKGTLDTVKGLGARIYSHCAFSSRLFCQTSDGAINAATILLQPPDGGQHAKIPITRIGMYTALAPGWQVPQGRFDPPIQHLITLRSLSSSIMNNNVGNFRRRSENPLVRDPEKSATEVQAEQVYENEAEQGRSMYRFRAWDSLHRKIFAKLLDEDYLLSGFSGEDKSEKTDALAKWLTEQFDEGVLPFDDDFTDDLPGVKYPGREAAIRFVARCALRNVPVRVLILGRWDIKANRGVGASSRAARVNALSQIRSMSQDLPPDRRRIVARLLAGEVANNSRFAEQMFPDLETGSFVSQTVSLIAIENAMFRKGEYIPPAEDQPHVDHIEGVLREGGGLIARFQESGRDPERLVALADFFEIGSRHAEGHALFLSNDPFFKDQARGFLEQISQMKATAATLRGLADQYLTQKQENLRALQEENARMRQQLESGAYDAQVRMQKQQLDHQIEVMDQQSLNESRVAKTQGAQIAQNIKLSQSERRAQEKHILSMQRDMEKLRIEIERAQVELQKARQQA